MHEEDEVTVEGGVIVRVVRTKKKVLGLEKGRLILMISKPKSFEIGVVGCGQY